MTSLSSIGHRSCHAPSSSSSHTDSSSSSNSSIAAPRWCSRLAVGAGIGCHGRAHVPSRTQWSSKQLTPQRARCRPAAAAAHAAVAATSAPTGQRVLYPQLSPHTSGYLKVSELHTLYYEVYGNPSGVPAVVLHGGPGAGCFTNHARFFDPAHYRIILVDQRGCGRSTPYGCLTGNTTADLVNDLEQLRRALGVQQWVMLGGSWGVTLTLAYAQAFPASVLGIVLRGVCLMRPQEISWMFGGGAAALKPLGWGRFLQPLSPQERLNPLAAYYRRLLSPDVNVRSEAAKSWSSWEMSVGFSAGQNVAVWDGQQWGEQATPVVQQQQQPQQPQQQQQQQQRGQYKLQPPPRPMGQAAVSAAAAAAGGLMPLLHRDLTGSSWFSSLQQQGQGTCTTSSTVASATHSATTTTAAAAAAQQRHSNNAGLHGLQRPRRRNGGAASSSGVTPTSSNQQAAAAGQQLQQESSSADLQLIQQGLQHRGFREQGHAQALLEAHYSIHAAFLQQQPLLEHLDRVRHIPCIAVQGQWDLVCPPTTAVELGQVWPEMELRLVPRAGHSMYDPAITHELVTATDRMRVLQQSQAALACAGQTQAAQVAAAWAGVR